MAPGLPDYAGFRVSAFTDHNAASGAVLDHTGGSRTYHDTAHFVPDVNGYYD